MIAESSTDISIASYIAAFVNSTKELQWFGATRRTHTRTERLRDHRCGNYAIFPLHNSSIAFKLFE